MRHKKRSLRREIKEILNAGVVEPSEILRSLLELGYKNAVLKSWGCAEDLASQSCPRGILLIVRKEVQQGPKYFQVIEIRGGWITYADIEGGLCSQLPIPVFDSAWKEREKVAIKVP